jgi:OmpA-OmpF porin, OOP family
MKKLLLIPALIAGTFAIAEDYKYELSPMIGYNFAEGNLNIKDNGYPVFGLEAQANIEDSFINPELSILYSHDIDYKTGGETKIIRGALNGVHNFDAIEAAIPFAKVGLGYEEVRNEVVQNESGLFADIGAGAKIPLMDKLALKFEAIYMAKLNTNNSGYADSNLVTMVGLTYSFGAKEQKQAPKPAEKVKATPVVVDGDDDKDGVLNSKDKCPNTLAGVSVDANGCDLDSDRDGVANAEDKCPNTPVGTKVDASGCKVDYDDDKDGVLNSKDICPNTPVDEAVNTDGCPLSIALNINFENDSAQIKAESQTYLKTYAEFLNSYTNYSAKIVGYTDSRGSDSYNQKLSERRAIAVAKDLISKGVNADQLTTLGRGEANPIADNTTAEGRAQNRRIEAELTRN